VCKGGQLLVRTGALPKTLSTPDNRIAIGGIGALRSIKFM
jgi:hypothetical protein